MKKNLSPCGTVQGATDRYGLCDDGWGSVALSALPSEYYYQGILDGYRQIGLPTQALKQAWDHCVGEVQRETERSNRRACTQLSPRQKKGPER
ncbi:MAG: hypothetical protein V8R07_04935 [Bacteroides fragilis]